MPSSLDISGPIAAPRSGWLTAITASLRENSPIILAVAILLAVADTLAMTLGSPHRVFDHLFVAYDVFASICFATFTFAFVVWFLHLTLKRNVSILSREAWRRVAGEFFSRDRILLALPILLVWPVMVRAFSQIKALIPAVQPYYLDPALFQWDRIIHFGHDPWTLLQPLLGYPLLTYGIDKAYALWLFVMYLAILLQITATGDRPRRIQFLLSSVLAWFLIGGLGAMLLSSAGPCYFAEVVGLSDPYGPLMSYLHSVSTMQLPLIDRPMNLLALSVQDLLWSNYQAGEAALGRGISAAPSMHVASTWLVARMAQTYGRKAAIAGWGFFAIILLGSVHLGWHYALDGYIGLICAWIIWRAVGWWLNRPGVRAFLWTRGLPALQRRRP